MKEFEIHIKTEQIRDVIRYLKKFKNALFVIHIDDDVIFSSLFSSHIHDIAQLQQMGIRIIIVCASRRRIDEILTSYNFNWHYNDNCRITDTAAMPMIKMAAFDVANQVMTNLAAENCNAVIGNWVRARTKGIINGIDFGCSGEIDKIQTESILKILSDGFIPIVPCIGWSIKGKPYNISSITLANELSKRLEVDKLFFLTKNIEITHENYTIPENIPISDKGNISAMNLEEAQLFIEANTNKESQFVCYLIKKAIDLCKSGVSRVHILNGSIDGTITCEIFSDIGLGTMIYEDNYGKIRSMRYEDIPSILTLIRPFVIKGILLPRTEQQLIDTCSDFIVYELDSGIRACAALHVYDEKQAEIAAVAVEDKWSNIGIGPKILTYLIDKAKKLNLDSVFVLTTQTSDWFEKQGFVFDDISTLPEERMKIWSPKRGSKLLRLFF